MRTRRLERLRLTAPRPGRVDALPYEVGERPPRGAAVALLLADGAPYARVHLPTELRARARIGDAATVRVEGFSETFSGRFRSISNEAAFTPYYALTEEDRGRLAYLAEVELTDPAADPPTGLPVAVHLAGGSAPEAAAGE